MIALPRWLFEFAVTPSDQDRALAEQILVAYDDGEIDVADVRRTITKHRRLGHRYLCRLVLDGLRERERAGRQAPARRRPPPPYVDPTTARTVEAVARSDLRDATASPERREWARRVLARRRSDVAV